MDLPELLRAAVKKNASDLHISPDQPPVIRVDGDLAPLDYPTLSADETKQLMYSVMTDTHKNIFEKTHECDFSTLVSDIARFRVNVFQQMHGVAGAFRAIPEKVPTLDELYMPPLFKDLLHLPNGLILITGPTGSGKSTTLSAMVDYLNENFPFHIITIEDPIEFTHKCKKSLINQREVHSDTLGFSPALRAALREDPDVILVGELRDLETIRLALTAAETGHLVLATLHTSSAPRTINRIVDVFPADEKNMIRNMLSESLQAVICQTLVKKISGGRIAAIEIMVATVGIRNLIREDKIAQMYSSMQTGSAQGMQTLDQCLQGLVSKGIISKEEASITSILKK